MLKRTRLIGLAAAAVVALAACGGYGDDDTNAGVSTIDAESNGSTAESAATSEDTSTVVATGSSEFGDILVGEGGLSLYGFTDDVDGQPTCSGGCADAWPALIVEGDDLPAGLDPEIFSIVEGVDGASQLKAGKWPLYFFAGDSEAGQVNGQNSGGVWFVVSPDGSLIKDAEVADTTIEDSTQAAETATDGSADDKPAGTAGY